MRCPRSSFRRVDRLELRERLERRVGRGPPRWRAALAEVISARAMHLDGTGLPVLDRTIQGQTRLGTLWGYVGVNERETIEGEIRELDPEAKLAVRRERTKPSSTRSWTGAACARSTSRRRRRSAGRFSTSRTTKSRSRAFSTTAGGRWITELSRDSISGRR